MCVLGVVFLEILFICMFWSEGVLVLVLVWWSSLVLKEMVLC